MFQVFVCAQTAMMLRHKSCVGRFDMGISIAGSTFSILIQTAVKLYWESISSFSLENNATIEAIAGAAQIVAALTMVLGSLSLPRRPHVYRDGRIVDGQLTVSALKR